ncbi:MAG: hypothetical protein ACRD0M_01945, partial [Acidimicrobiales bacterium]
PSATGVLRWWAPATGAFSDLLLWHEGPMIEIGDRSSLVLEGVVAAPAAHAHLNTGPNPTSTVNTQFFVESLEVVSGAWVVNPDPGRAVPTALGVRLIR